MKIQLAQPVFELKLGIPAFSGDKDVMLKRKNGPCKGLNSWSNLTFVNGSADVPRGWKPVEDGNGYVITRDRFGN